MAHVCKICGKSVTTSFSLKCHLRIHSGERPFECRLCGKKFTTSITLRTHASVHTGERPFKCSTCQKCFRLKTQLNEHLQVHTEHNYNCKECGKLLKNERSLRAHMKRHTAGDSFTCSTCNKSFGSERYLKIHLDIIHSGVKPHSCDVCGQAFGLQSSLLRHMKLHKDERKYQCEVCGKGYLDRTTLKNHMLSHEGVKPHECEICQKRFLTISEVNTHKKIHSVREKCPCPICGKMYTDAKCVRSHLRFAHSEIKDGARNFYCEYCGKTFKFKSQLLRHKSTHEQKTHSCSVCNKAFADVFSLRRHAKVHSDETPFSCDVCHKAFKDKRLLVRHKLVHSDEAPFLCALCGKRFKLPKQLELHLLITHSEERPNQCWECGKRYKRKQDLKRHKCATVKTEEISVTETTLGIDSPEHTSQERPTNKETADGQDWTDTGRQPCGVGVVEPESRSFNEDRCPYEPSQKGGQGPATYAPGQHEQPQENLTNQRTEAPGFPDTVHSDGRPCGEDTALELKEQQEYGAVERSQKQQDSHQSGMEVNAAESQKERDTEPPVRECGGHLDSEAGVNETSNWRILNDVGDERERTADRSQNEKEQGDRIGVEEESSRENSQLQTKTMPSQGQERMDRAQNETETVSESVQSALRCSDRSVSTVAGSTAVNHGEPCPSTALGENDIAEKDKADEQIIDGSGTGVDGEKKQICGDQKEDLENTQVKVGGADLEDCERETAAENPKKKIYKCKKCGKTYTDLHGFAGHGKSHRRVRRYKCSECCRTFHTEAELANHSRAHDSGQYGCSVCGKSFRETRYLSKHIDREHGSIVSAQSKGIPRTENSSETAPSVSSKVKPKPLKKPPKKTTKSKQRKPRTRRALKETQVRRMRGGRKRGAREVGPDQYAKAKSASKSERETASDRELNHSSGDQSAASDTEDMGYNSPDNTGLYEEPREEPPEMSEALSGELKLFKEIADQEPEVSAGVNTEILAAIKEESGTDETPHLSEEAEGGVTTKQAIKSEERGMGEDANRTPSSHEDSEMQDLNYNVGKRAKTRAVNKIVFKYKCEECGKKSVRKHDHLHHLETHSGEYRYFCEICETKVKTRKSLLCHLNRHVKDANVCPHCAEYFEDKNDLKSHVLSHAKYNGKDVTPKSYYTKKVTEGYCENELEKDYKFNCADCDKRFKYNSDFLRHTATHSKAKSFLCGVCDSHWRDEDALKVHMYLHVGPNNTCMHCHESFPNEEDVSTHMLTHTTYTRRPGAKHREQDVPPGGSASPHSCPVCSKSFAFKSDLETHEMVHSPMQHYCCMICKKYLKLRRGAREHMRRHIEANNTCSHCQQSFDDSAEIVEHMETHIQFDPKGKPVSARIVNIKHSSKINSKYVCPVCGEEFTRETHFDEHMVKQHNKRVHECPLCHSSYGSRSNLSAHMLIHSTDYRFICDICHRGFHTSYKLNAHKISHSTERPYVCEICDFACKRKSALEEHKTRHRDEKPYECDVCHKTFAYASGLRSHKKIHSDVRQHVCDVCGSSFKRLAYLKKHLHTHMNKTDRPKPYTCKICGKSYITSSDLKVHELRHRGELNHQCQKCSKKFLTACQLKVHERTHMDRDNSFICDMCGKGFKESAHLQEHKRRHSDTRTRRIQCDQCPRTFMYPNELKRHQMTHTGERPWSCDTCGKSFREKSVLATHVLQHSGVQQFKCETCNKSFERKIYLTLHTRIHTGDKPYTCRYCNKKIRTKTHLTNHERTHTGEKPYACDECPSRFSTNTGLVSHKLVHSDTKQYSCQFCSKTFRQVHHLRNHELTHTGTKPHKCDKCDKAFTQKQSLKAHLLTHTAVNTSRLEQQTKYEANFSPTLPMPFTQSHFNHM